MQNLKIRVNNEAESKEVQELFLGLGYVKDNWLWSGYSDYPIELRTRDGGYSDFKLNAGGAIERQEITLPELRAMANQDQDEQFLTPETTLNDQYAEIEQVRQHEMKEYLIPSANYKYQKAYPIASWREWVEIPEGAEWAKLWDKGEFYECVEFYRGKNEFFSNSSKKWMRGADESTNKIGQPATIIWNRYTSNSAASGGTAKAKPDFNFGAAQAVKDNVNHPSHYTQGKVECIDALESATIGKSGIEAVCVANVIKYLWRYEEKNGVEDVKKAKFYLNRLLATLENNNG